MDVDAAQQELFPVQDEAVLRVEFNRTEAEFRSDPVDLRAGLVEELGCAGVEIRRVRRPELRVSDREGGCGAVVRGSPFSGRVVNREKHVPGERTLRRDPDMAVDLCVDDESVAQKVQRSDPPQADAAVDAAAGVPARGLLDRVVGTYRDKVFSRHECIGDVGFEAGIAVEVLEDVPTVHKEVGGAVDSVEIEQKPLAASAFGPEALAVVDDSVRQVGVLRAVRQRGVERLTDAPVVRQVHRRPAGVVETGFLESRHVPRAEFPVRIETFASVSHNESRSP